LTIHSDLHGLSRVQNWFRQYCVESSPDGFWLKQEVPPLNVALTEGVSNAMRHAHQTLPIETEIDIDLKLWNDRIEIRVWDYGQPFDPNSVEEPIPGVPRLGGYGWFLMRRLTDQVRYERSQDGRNCLVMVKEKTKKRISTQKKQRLTRPNH
jgi:serine/threonine-protein kinase RsbW